MRLLSLETRLAADVAAHDLAKQLPGFALEPLQLNLRDRSKVGRRRVDLDARQQAAEFEVLDAGCLLHDVLAREIVAAGFQDLNEPLCDGVTEHHRSVDAVAFRE